ncbi:hypothetical protein L596_020164 [Steinernema carpocapsae]|uniref:Uncharacterized protein n=1 Tax=Steinernema carpocapsae TaxID=34508 RepID=A0A4U5MSQ1_STECR|nr:hypothetical protein L596_020164 [Steinernema carpocapsae]
MFPSYEEPANPSSFLLRLLPLALLLSFEISAFACTVKKQPTPGRRRSDESTNSMGVSPRTASILTAKSRLTRSSTRSREIRSREEAEEGVREQRLAEGESQSHHGLDHQPRAVQRRGLQPDHHRLLRLQHPRLRHPQEGVQTAGSLLDIQRR